MFINDFLSWIHRELRSNWLSGVGKKVLRWETDCWEYEEGNNITQRGSE